MSSTTNKDDSETSAEATLNYKEILKSNSVTDDVSEVIIESSGQQGEGLASITKYVTVKFKNPTVKPLNLFVKTHIKNESHSKTLMDGKLFEKESRFFMEYVPAAKEFCKSKGFALHLHPQFLILFRVVQKNASISGKDEVIDFLNSNVGQGFNQILSTINYTPEEEALLGLAHGDYHNNNMMFLKDNETGQILKHLAIDLQVTRCNSPGLDLALYLFSSVEAEVRRNHFNELLGRYFYTLTAIALKLGHPINPSYEEMHLIYRRKVKYGFWFALCIPPPKLNKALKNIDVSEIGDLSNFSAHVDKLIQNWIDDNPEKAGDHAQVIIDLVNEFRQLTVE